MKFTPYHYPAIFDRTFSVSRRAEGVACALLCATSLEAFVNDVVSFYELREKNPVIFLAGEHPAANYLTDDESKLLTELRSIERKPIQSKFIAICNCDSSRRPYQDFSRLIKIRNAIAHIKPEEQTKENAIIDGIPDFFNDFFQSKTIERPSEFGSWIELIENQEFCLWCQKTTWDMVEFALAELPESNAKKHFLQEIRFSFDPNKAREG